jgi:nucleoside-diphosphate-sugar epimerase
MKILVTGSNGFLGNVLCQYLRPTFQLKTLSKSAGDYKIKLDDCIPTFNESFNIVIHAAGLAHFTPRNQFEMELFYKVNVIGTINLLEGLVNASIPDKFVFISSVAVYGKTAGSLINESSKLNAIDSYGKSKIDAEFEIINWCEKHNVICTILRLPLIVGFKPPGNLKSMINGIRRGYYFNIDGGRARKSMVLAEDIAKYILLAAEVGGIYNLTDGYHPTFKELADKIAYQLGKNEPKNLPFWFTKLLSILGDLYASKTPIYSDKLNKITSELTFDDSKACEAFGWKPSPVLESFNVFKTEL